MKRLSQTRETVWTNPARAMGRAARVALPLLAIAGLTACSSTMVRPVVTNHGYVPDQEKIETLKVGETTMASVKESLGTPSSAATFSNDTWYYISETQETFAFLDTETTDRKVLALKFDQTGKLAQIDRYDITDGRVVNFSDQETPTRGRELTFLEQMFGNVGRGLPGNAGGNPNEGLNIPRGPR